MLGPGRGTRTPSVRPPNGILYAVEIQNYCGRSRIQLNRIIVCLALYQLSYKTELPAPTGLEPATSRLYDSDLL